MRFQVRYTTRAAEQRDSLPPSGKRALTWLERRLRVDPWRAGQEAKSENAWYADFGGFGDFGQAKYLIGEGGGIQVTILFITWVG